MSKVICDVCGTSFPETSMQCPICGCVRPADSAVVNDNGKNSGGYAYVKGGRFSKANVVKHSQGVDFQRAPATNTSGSNKKALAFIIVLICLFLLLFVLIGAGIWGIVSVFNANDSDPQQTEQTVACTGLDLVNEDVVFDQIDTSAYISVSPYPANCTEKIEFKSMDPAVATVDDNGLVTCVGEGETKILITCGDQTVEFIVSCAVEMPTELPTVPPDELQLTRKSVHESVGFTWILYIGTVPIDEITWTSDDPTVAIVTDGLLELVGEGETTVHAQYNGSTASCEIICTNEEPTEESGFSDVGEMPTEATPNESGNYTMRTTVGTTVAFNDAIDAYDITVHKNESFKLYLRDEQGNNIQLDWTIVEGDSCTLDDNYIVVHTTATNCYMEAVHNGVTYRCYIRTAN